jgi:hypothetical protein
MSTKPVKRGCYAIKTYGNYLYTWCPEAPTYSNKGKGMGDKKSYCDALPSSQGQDWICTYVYNISVLNGEQQRLAYVECDYVK